jgi:hypothetical protein
MSSKKGAGDSYSVGSIKKANLSHWTVYVCISDQDLSMGENRRAFHEN